MKDPGVSVSGAGQQLFVLIFAMAAGGYAQSTVSPLQESMRISWSLSDHQMAVLQGPALGIPIALAAIPLGIIIDRFSRARLLLVLVAVGLGGSLLTAFASNFDTLILARGLVGVGAFGSVPVILSLLADLYPPAQRGRVMSMATVGQIVGGAAAFALGGELIAMTASRDGGWQWAMFWLATPLVPVSIAMLKVREPPRTGVTTVNPGSYQVWKGLGQHRRTIISLAAGFALAQLAIGAMMTWAAPMLSRDLGLAPDRIGTLMAIGILVSGILGPIAGGALADACQRLGGPFRAASVLCGLAVLSAPACLFAYASLATAMSVLLIAALTLLLAIGLMAMTIMTVVLPNEVRGLSISALAAVSLFFSVAVAPPLVSLVSGALGGAAMIGKALSLVCMASSLLAAVAFACARRTMAVSVIRRPADVNAAQ